MTALLGCRGREKDISRLRPIFPALPERWGFLTDDRWTVMNLNPDPAWCVLGLVLDNALAAFASPTGLHRNRASGLHRISLPPVPQGASWAGWQSRE